MGDIYKLGSQPARIKEGTIGVIEVYLGAGRWKIITDPTGSFAYARKLHQEAVGRLMAAWDKDPILPRKERGG